jgi:uncharacterized protein (TIGR03437 family)
MTKDKFTRLSFFRPLMASVACLIVAAAGMADTGLFLGSKAPYVPQQDPSSYEAPPSGFSPVFTQIVARHGSRGLSSASNDLALYNMWLQAQASGGVTKKGSQMGLDLLTIIRANALLADFNGSNAPTALDGIGVTVNGKPAFVYYVSPSQININTPEDTATGPVSIQVKTPLGLSNVVTANRGRLSPTLQTVPQFNIGGKQYVVALTLDFVNYIGRPRMLQEVPFIAAKPGDTVSIYALGCGPTNPPTQAGVVAAQGSPIASPFQFKIGGVPATVPFAGMVGRSIGLYQFNVVIPAVAAGDQTIELTVDGISNGQNLVITIGS